MNQEVFRDATGTFRALADGQLQLFNSGLWRDLMNGAYTVTPEKTEEELWAEIEDLRGKL